MLASEWQPILVTIMRLNTCAQSSLGYSHQLWGISVEGGCEYARRTVGMHLDIVDNQYQLGGVSSGTVLNHKHILPGMRTEIATLPNPAYGLSLDLILGHGHKPGDKCIEIAGDTGLYPKPSHRTALLMMGTDWRLGA